MSLVLTRSGTVVCAHELGLVSLRPSQTWVRIDGEPVLVKGDLAGRPVAGCPFFTGTNKPCTKTLREQQAWSTLVAIDGVPICLDITWGMTDAGPGVWRYAVQQPGQRFVADSAGVEPPPGADEASTGESAP